jgi:hypothetical protein
MVYTIYRWYLVGKSLVAGSWFKMVLMATLLLYVPTICHVLIVAQSLKLLTLTPHVFAMQSRALCINCVLCCRSCWKCKRNFIKEAGCNKMTCNCGAAMCYICRQPVTNYTHFNGEGGTEFNKLVTHFCHSLWMFPCNVSHAIVIQVS